MIFCLLAIVRSGRPDQSVHKWYASINWFWPNWPCSWSWASQFSRSSAESGKRGKFSRLPVQCITSHLVRPKLLWKIIKLILGWLLLRKSFQHQKLLTSTRLAFLWLIKTVTTSKTRFICH